MPTWLRRHWLPLTLALIYTTVFGTFSLLRHWTFQTQTWDLAVFEQSFWYTLQGRLFFNVFENANHLSVHFSPFLLALVPVYALAPGPTVLLVLQALALGLGVIPLYRMAERWVGRRTALVVATAYLLYPSLHWVNLFDFHEVPFAVPALLWAFDYLDRERRLAAAIALAVAASTAENMILVVAGVGLYLLLVVRGQRRYGAAVLITSLAYFWLAATVIMPALGGKVYRWDRYEHLGRTPGAIVQTVLTNPLAVWTALNQPEKRAYLVRLFAPVAALPLVAPASLLLLVPGLAQNLLTNYANQYSGTYQYDALLIPFLFVGVAQAWRGLHRRWPAAVPTLGWAAIGVSLGACLWWSPLGLTRYPWASYRFDARVMTLTAFKDRLPPDAAVAVPTNLVPHLTHRDRIWMTGMEPAIGAAEIVVVDLWEALGFISPQQFRQYLSGYLASGAYRAQRLKQRYLVLIRQSAHPPPPSP